MLKKYSNYTFIPLLQFSLFVIFYFLDVAKAMKKFKQNLSQPDVGNGSLRVHLRFRFQKKECYHVVCCLSHKHKDDFKVLQKHVWLSETCMVIEVLLSLFNVRVTFFIVFQNRVCFCPFCLPCHHATVMSYVSFF